MVRFGQGILPDSFGSYKRVIFRLRRIPRLHKLQGFDMQEKSIQKNMVMSAILTLSNFVFPLITYSYVARVLTAAGTGRVSFVNSILSYFVYFAGLGIQAHGRRESAKVRDDKVALSRLTHELLCINVVTVLLSYAALTIAVLAIPKLQAYLPLILIMSVQVFLSPMGVEWFYQGLEEYAYITKRSLLCKCIAVAMTFVFVRDINDVLWYGFISIFTTCASNVCNVWNLRKYIHWKPLGGYDVRKHIKPVLWLFASTIAVTVYANFDVSMLGFVSTEHEVGLYNAAFRIETILLSLSTAITSVLIPRMANYFSKERWTDIRNLTSKIIRISLLLALPVALYVFVFAENVVSFIGGAEYVTAGNTLRIKMLCVIPLTFTSLFGTQLLIPMGNEKRYTQSVTIGLFINLVMNALLIPRFGAAGAALGTLATECWNVVWMGLGVREYVEKDVKYLRYILPMLVAAVAAFAMGNWVCTQSVFWNLVVTASVFFGIYYTAQYVQKESIVYTYANRILTKAGVQIKMKAEKE